MLPFTAVMPMDVQQQAWVEMHAEERFKNGNDIKTIETELNPVLRYDYIWKGGQNHLVAIYKPRFLYTRNWDQNRPNPNLVNLATLNLVDPNKDPFSALHNGGVGYEMVRSRWRLSLYQFAAYGSISTTALLVPPIWEGGIAPPDPNPIIPSTIGARFNLVFVQTQLFVPIRLSPRTALIPGFTYNVFGGADRDSRAVIALTFGPAASIALDHAATKNDRFVSSLTVGQVDTKFQDDRDTVTILRTEATQSWRHWFTGNLSSELMAGAALGGDSINGFSIFSLGQAALLYDTYALPKIPPGAPPYGGPGGHGHRFQFGAVAKVAPWIDLFSGDLEQRAVLSLAANYTIDRITFRGIASQARVVNTPRSVAEYQILFTEAGIRYRLTPTIYADAGLRLAYQNFNNAVRFNELSQATAFAGLTWAPYPAHF